MAAATPRLFPVVQRAPGHPPGRFGDPLVDDYLAFLAVRVSPNSVLAAWYDLLVFTRLVDKSVVEVTPRDVMAFITAQRTGQDHLPARPVTTGPLKPVSARTIHRRLSTISGFYAFLTVRGDITTNPVPRGLPTRRERNRPRQGVPLVRPPRTLPTILTATEVDALTAALRTHRDRAMVSAMLLGGLRRCEVLGLRLEDLHPGTRRIFVRAGKGGHQRLVPISPVFFEHLAAYLDTERPADTTTDVLFVSLKRPQRGQPLTPAGLDEVLDSARRRAGLRHATCHQLRHTCLTRLREAGMPLEAVQAQAGHASIETTRIYLHLADDWLATQYRKASEVIDAQVFVGVPIPPTPAPQRPIIPGFRRLR